MKDDAVRGWGHDPGMINVKRGAALTKYPIVLAIIFASVAIFAANLGNAFLEGLPMAPPSLKTLRSSLVR